MNNMRIITISREFGSGGRELGKRLSDELGFDYYDKEIITAVAKTKGLDAEYVEKALDHHAWRSIPLVFGRSFGMPAVQTIETELLLEQRRVLEGIAKLGKDCVIVGRNADLILEKEKPFNIFVCAETDAKVKRCLQRAKADEQLSEKDVLQHMRRIDKNRASTRAILSDSEWGKGGTYHLTVNTTGWSLKALAPAVAQFALKWFESNV